MVALAAFLVALLGLGAAFLAALLGLAGALALGAAAFLVVVVFFTLGAALALGVCSKRARAPRSTVGR